MEDKSTIEAGGKEYLLNARATQYRNELREVLPESLYQTLDNALGEMYRDGEIKGLSQAGTLKPGAGSGEVDEM